MLESGDEAQTLKMAVPENTEVTIHIAEEGEGESYIGYQRPDGTFRRLITFKGGGPIRIRTARE